MVNINFFQIDAEIGYTSVNEYNSCAALITTRKRSYPALQMGDKRRYTFELCSLIAYVV
jgi:hypothetical protein